MTRNELKNFCDFIDNRDWQAESIAESGLTETRRLTGEHLYNLMLDADVKEALADRIADTLADNFVRQTKDCKKIDYSYENKMLTSVVTFEDDSKIYIFIQRGMIFIADYDYEELSRRIENDDTESFEAYDTLDGCDYYAQSAYAEYVNKAFIHLTNVYMFA